jgi:hypothetical protein
VENIGTLQTGNGCKYLTKNLTIYNRRHIVRTTKSRNIRRDGHVAHMGRRRRMSLKFWSETLKGSGRPFANLGANARILK